MYDSWTSLAIPARLRREFWRDICARAFVPMTPQLRRADDFQAAMVHRTIDCLALNEVRGPAHDMWRTAADLSCGGSPVLFVNLYRTGNARIVQNGQEVEVGPQRLLLFDSCRPFKLQHSVATDLLSLAVPHALLGDRTVQALGEMPWRLPGTAPALLLMNQMQALSKWQADIQALDGACIAQAMVSLLRALMPEGLEPRAAPPHRRHARAKVAALIGRHYADPDYSPLRAAAEIGVSVRSLHAWLAGDGTSFGTELWGYRLERVRTLLKAEPQLSIQEAASRCGFASCAHLSRRFRERFGMAPKAWRDMHDEGLAVALPDKLAAFMDKRGLPAPSGPS